MILPLLCQLSEIVAMPNGNMSEIDEELIAGFLDQKLEAEAAKLYVQRYYGKIYTVQDVADALDLGYHSLRKKFKHNTGQSIGQFLMNTKIENAKIFLQETNLSVKEIAFKVGFTDPSHFSKIFKKYVGTSPREYKTRKRNDQVKNLN